MLEFNERGSHEKSIPLQSNVNERLLTELKAVRDRYNQTYYELQISREKVDSLEEENRLLKAKTSIRDQWDFLLRSSNETLSGLQNSVDNAIQLLQFDTTKQISKTKETKKYVNNEKILLADSKENGNEINIHQRSLESIESNKKSDIQKHSEQNHTTNISERSSDYPETAKKLKM